MDYPSFSANGSDTQNHHNEAYTEKTIAETINNGLFSVDAEWRVQYWNKGAEKLLGVLQKDIIGHNLWEKFAGLIPVHFYATYHKAFLQDVPVRFQEYWEEMGTWFEVNTYCYNHILSVSFKSISHVPSPSWSQQRLKIVNELYKFVTEVTNDCLWEWDLPNKEIFWIDGGHKRVFGYQIENALIPQSFWESRVHPDDRVRVMNKFNKVTSDGTSVLWEDEYRFQKSNGEYAYVHDRGHMIYEDKKPSRMIGATQDITERKLTELQLLESEKKLSLIAKQTVNAVIITDTDEKIIWVNSAFTRITEYEESEVIGQKPESFLYGKETDPATVQYLREKIAEQQPSDCDIVQYSKSGRRYWLHIHKQPLFNEKQECDRFFSIGTDITEKILLQKKLEQERLTRQLEITEAVLTAQEFEREEIGKELHDNLNQILGAAKLYVDLAKKKELNRNLCLGKASECIVSVIEEIRKISKTMGANGLFVLGFFERVQILVNDVMMTSAIKIEFNNTGIIANELDEKLQLNIFRIIQEQVNNIIRHAKASHAKIDLSRRGDKIMLVISDNGQGCNTSEKRKGVGIRNIMSRAELYGGKVLIVSGPGKGYKLIVEFQSPAARPT
jgi:PAS domain S-box-containing protein